MDFDTAARWANHVGGRVGYCISADDPYACIDLDVKPGTTSQQQANLQAIVDDFASYSELSQSGLGMHIWVRGKTGSGRKDRFDGVEVYSQERFIICTGNAYRNIPIARRQDLLARLVGRIRGSLGSMPNLPPDGPQTLDDDQLLNLAHAADNGAAFTALWEGRWQGTHGSASEADLALMSNLGFYSPNNVQCCRLFLRSALGGRNKFASAKPERRWYLLRRLLCIVRNRSGASADHGKQIAEVLLASWQKQDDDWLVRIDDVVTNPSPPPEFLTEQLLPAKNVTLLAADGGMGKTRLIVTWAAHAAVGRPFLGKWNQKAPVVVYSAEDDRETMRHLLKLICEHFELSPTEVAKNLHLVDASDIDSAVLFDERTTAVYERLKRLTDRVGARYVFVDNASEVYEGDEIRRREVKGFIRSLKLLAKAHRAAVLLLAHVNRETAKGFTPQGQEYSGNTAWNNSVRSRLYLGPYSQEDPTLTLFHRKTNYGKLAAPISLAWTQGNLLAPMTQDEADGVRATRNAEQTRQLVDIVRATVSVGINIPHADTGPKTTFSVLKGQPFFPQGLEKKRHDKLIAEAINDGLLRVDEYRKGGKAAFRLVAVDT